MTALLLQLFLGSLALVPQDVEGVMSSGVRGVTGAAQRNFLPADLNGDDRRDLVFGDSVLLQSAAGYAPANRIDLPAEALAPEARLDISADGRTIYVLRETSVTSMEWEQGGWRLSEKPLAPPPQEAGAGAEEVQEGGGAPDAPMRLERFLFAPAAGAKPLIIIPRPEGLLVYEETDQSWRQQGLLDVYPQPRSVHERTPQLWPAGERKLSLPRREMICRVLLTASPEGARILVIKSSPAATSEEIFFAGKEYRLVPGGGRWNAVLEQEWTTAPLPKFVEPCQLNQDRVVDFAGSAWDLPDGDPLPSPVHTVCIAASPGEDLQFIRSRGYRPQATFADADGDGDLDLAVAPSALTGGGVRESIVRFVTQQRLRQDVLVYLQDPVGRFQEHPALRGRVAIDLGAPPVNNNRMLQYYRTAELMDMSGDFNGDGRMDIAVRRSLDELVVYEGGDEGFANRPLVVLPMKPEWRFAVDDVDGDGRSDIIVRWPSKEQGKPLERSRLFLTREEGSP
jgi:hypothetical protein